MRSRSKKSHGLSREGARTIAVSGYTQREAQHGHEAVNHTTALQGGAHLLSSLATCSGGTLRVREDPPSPGLIPGRTFRWAEQPEGPHDGSTAETRYLQLHPPVL